MKNFSFNGITKDYIRALKGSNRPSWAPVTRVYQEVPNRAGAHLIKKRKTSPRPLPVPVYLKADSIADLQKSKEHLAAWLIHDDPKPLIFDDEPDRVYYATVDGSFDIDEFVSVGQGVIPFICPDPFKYASMEKIVSLGQITNTGTVATNAIINMTLTQNTSEVIVSHVQSGGYVRVLYNFIAGDKLVIDLQKRKIVINNVVRMTSYDWRSKPFELLPGANTITVTPSNPNATAKFRERWL